MKSLRELNKFLDNAPKINEFVDVYLNESILNNKFVTIITPWSLSKKFEKRYEYQSNKFSPTSKEIKLFRKEIPNITNIFLENGLKFNWYLIFSRSYTQERLISFELEKEYTEMIQNVLIEYSSLVEIINWEDDIIEKRHYPNLKLLNEKNFNNFISEDKFMVELKRWEALAKDAGLSTKTDDLIKQVKYHIACEAEEGRFLMESKENPICEPGNFIFMPLGRAERYISFSVLVPEFEKRTVCVLQPYPWRID